MGEIRTIVTVSLNSAIDRIIEVPDFRVGGHLPMKQLRRHPAGKAINVSRALALLGRRSIATGFVGEHEIAAFERFLDSVAGPRIVCQFLPVRGATRENLTLIDPQQHVDTHLRDPGFTVSPADVARMTSKLGLLARQDVVVCFSGSLPPGLSVEQFVAMLRQCINNGARVVVDTSGPALQAACELPLWMIKPNDEELVSVAGRSVRPLDAARALARHIPIVLTTMGAEGAGMVTADQALHARLDLDADDVVNTVGCGDCLVGGFLAAMAEGSSHEQALRLGVAAAAANTLSISVAEFDGPAVRALVDRVQVGPWNPR